jgi:hypothetical protein
MNAHTAAIETFVSETTKRFGAPPTSITILRQGETEMAFEQKDNSGVLFKNDRKEGEHDPDFNGSITVSGVEYRLNAWVRTSKAGRKYLGLSVKIKEDAKPKPVESAGAGHPFDDDLAFAPERR